ncbi:tape measure protein [Endozoicomonas sp. ALB115]|uniref:tape measure protein n=1 Tax=Endozoicomonas sp. ALB115 TaxID=3403074 RepID=UPI003BB80C47
MSRNNPNLRIEISALDRLAQPMRRINRRFEQLQRPVGRLQRSLRGLGREAGLQRMGTAFAGIGRSVGKVGKELGGVITKMGVLGGLAGAGGLAVGKSFVDTAAQFEKFETILSRLEGSKEAGKKSMAWIEDFAAKTPYELEQVTDAFVKLRAYGMDPINGDLLRTLGDTSAAMGKDMMQAVEAIADAVTGENERLKEFGIKAASSGNKIVYEYTNSAGKTMRKAVQKGNREMIQSTLQMIWNDKYGGAMKDLSGTWQGMISNLLDQWSRFKRLVMESGPFELLKEKLGGLLDRLNQMSETGELKRRAEELGKTLVSAFYKTRDAVKELYSGFQQLKQHLQQIIDFGSALVERFGGVKVVLTALAVLIGGKLIIAMGALLLAFKTLGAAMLLTPFGLITTAIAGLVYAGVELYQRFEIVRKVFKALWAFNDKYNPFLGMVRAANHLIKVLTGFDILDSIKTKLANLLPAWITRKLGWSIDSNVAEPTTATPSAGDARSAAAVRQQAARQQSVDVHNRAAVTVDFANVPRGTQVKTRTDRGTDLDTSLDYAMSW